MVQEYSGDTPEDSEDEMSISELPDEEESCENDSMVVGTRDSSSKSSNESSSDEGDSDDSSTDIDDFGIEAAFQQAENMVTNVPVQAQGRGGGRDGRDGRGGRGPYVQPPPPSSLHAG